MCICCTYSHFDARNFSRQIGNIINIDEFRKQMFSNVLDKKSIFENIYKESVDEYANNYISFLTYQLVLRKLIIICMYYI